MRLLLYPSCICFLCIGLWDHDWLVIGMCSALIIATPTIIRELQEDKRRRELDRLWDDDDDLTRSA